MNIFFIGFITSYWVLRLLRQIAPCLFDVIIPVWEGIAYKLE